MAMSNANAKAAAARARMAKRAKRARFMKENKKRITMIIVGFFILLALCFLTPWGPGYYRMKIEERKMQSPTAVSSGVIRDLYKLGEFYQYTMRSKDALACYDEIARLYFGFRITEFPRDPAGAFEKRRLAEVAIKKGMGNGPPFSIDESEILYVAKAVWRAGEIMSGDRSKNHILAVYRDLYQGELQQKFPHHMDSEINEIVKNWIDRQRGAR